MGAILPLTGAVAVPAGATAGDVIFRHIGVVRGSQKVAGGSFMGRVEIGTGKLLDINGQPVKVPVLFPGDFTDRHPYLEVGISWRGAGVGYSFEVDLLVPEGRTEIELTEASDGGKPVEVAERIQHLQSLLDRGDALLASVVGAGQRAATAADFAYAAAHGQIFATYAEMDAFAAADGAWASVGLHSYYRREGGEWIPYEIGRLPVRLNDALPTAAQFWQGTDFYAPHLLEQPGAHMETVYQAIKPVTFDKIHIPALQQNNLALYEVISERGEVLAAGRPQTWAEDGLIVPMGRVLSFAPGRKFTLRLSNTASGKVTVTTVLGHASADGALNALGNGVVLAANFVLGETVASEVIGTLKPQSFPVVQTVEEIPAGGVARMGNHLMFRDVDGEAKSLVDGVTTYDAQNPLPLSAVENGAALAGALARITALEQKPALDIEAVQDVVGGLLGENQGHYDDNAGTYSITFPASGGAGTAGPTDEQIQDMMAQFVKAGQNVTLNYDDVNNILTIMSSGGGGSLATVAVTNNLRGTGAADSPLDVSPELAGTVARISALEQATGTSTAKEGGASFSRPNDAALYQQYYDTTLNKLLICTGRDASNRPAWRTAEGIAVAYVSPLGETLWEYFRWVFTEGSGKGTGIMRLQYGANTAYIKPTETPSFSTAGRFDWDPSPTNLFGDAAGYAWSATGETTIMVQPAAAQTLSGYKMYNSGGTVFPTAWRFEASHDGQNWTVLDSVTDFPKPASSTWIERTF